MYDPLLDFYLKKDEPIKSYLLALHDLVLRQDKDISSQLKYGMPFFSYRGRMFCYLWIQQKTNMPYLGIVEGNRIDHPDLMKEKRSRMKIMILNPSKDIPVKKITSILKKALDLYK